MSKDFLLGCSWRGVQHYADVPVKTQFELIRDAGVFDYLDRLPLPDVIYFLTKIINTTWQYAGPSKISC